MITPNSDGRTCGGPVLWMAPGRPVAIGPERGRGGEACIHSLSTGGLVKVYHRHVIDAPERRTLRPKIETMMRLSALRVDARFAWPAAAVFTDQACTRWAGFVMRELSGVGLHALCSLAALRENLPGWNRLHLTRAAIALFDLALTLEKHGVIMSDVSAGNFRVDRKTATVAALDCDSFQVTAEGVCFRSPVHTPKYAPPELLDRPADAIVRTSCQLVFSLGLLAYELLTSGLHAYSRAWGEDPCNNLRTGKTAMGGSRASGFLPPELFQRYNGLHPAVKRVCVRTFVDGHAVPAARPTLAEWREALRVQFMALKAIAAAKSA